MTDIILCGCSGAMGRTIAGLAADRDDCRIAAGIDPRPLAGAAFPVFASLAECGVHADVLIDFSNPASLDDILVYVEANGVPAVLCTTGYSDEQLAAIDAAAKKAALFRSGNMSLGINLLITLAKKATAVLGSTFDIEIVEAHHNQKLDAPSGTALMIAEAISGSLDEQTHYEYDRHSRRRKRGHDEIGIHSIRGGTITGEHEVIFAGPNEVVKISHSAQSKGVFAAGALNAAVFLSGKPAGMYDMNDLLASV